MHVDRSIRPEDLPAPPTPDEAARGFTGALLTLEPQPAVEEVGIGIGGHSRNGLVTLEEATSSFILWRNPADRGDPANLAELSDEARAQLDAEPESPLPDWIMAARERMRYPWLWDAVRTTRIADPEESARRTPESVLVEHVNYILMNTFREERVRGGDSGDLLGRATEAAVERGVPLRIDGAEVDGIRIDTDAHVLGVGARVGDRILSAVFPRDLVPHFDLAFATRATADPTPA